MSQQVKTEHLEGGTKTPGVNKVYGTDGVGNPGFYDSIQPDNFSGNYVNLIQYNTTPINEPTLTGFEMRNNGDDIFIVSDNGLKKYSSTGAITTGPATTFSYQSLRMFKGILSGVYGPGGTGGYRRTYDYNTLAVTSSTMISNPLRNNGIGIGNKDLIMRNTSSTARWSNGSYLWSNSAPFSSGSRDSSHYYVDRSDGSPSNVYKRKLSDGTLVTQSPSSYNIVSIVCAYGSVWLVEGNNIIKLNSTTLAQEASIAVGTAPKISRAYNGNLYICNSGSNTISIINPTTNTVTSTVASVGGISDILFTNTAMYELGTTGGLRKTVFANAPTPDSGKMVLYFKGDGKLYCKNSSNVESLIGTQT